MQSINSNIKVVSPKSQKLREQADRRDEQIQAFVQGEVLDRLEILKTFVASKDNCPEDSDKSPNRVVLTKDDQGKNAYLTGTISSAGTAVFCSYPELGIRGETDDCDKEPYLSSRFEKNQEVIEYDNMYQSYKMVRSTDTGVLTIFAKE